MHSKTLAIKLSNHTTLFGDLTLVDHSTGLVVFAHGSGSSRMSNRNRFVAGVMQKYGLSTLLFDLLTREEELVDDITREYRFNIPLLARRLTEVTQWIHSQPDLIEKKVGYFGASTGAAAALIAATLPSLNISAVVSRGGRPDLAESQLALLKCPTLLLVGEHDYDVLELNKKAMKQISSGQAELHIIPEATHLFEEPGTLEEVAEEAATWFGQYLSLAIPAPLKTTNTYLNSPTSNPL